MFDDVINLPCKNLQQAVEYVQQHSKGGDSGTTDKATLRCSFCKAAGHTAKTCRKKNKPQRSKKVDEIQVESDVDVDACDESSSWGDPEAPDLDCLSEVDMEEVIDMFPAEAEIEDLGKQKRGSNDARDQIVKKLRSTPPNPTATMGGYKEVPVQKMPGLTRG